MDEHAEQKQPTRLADRESAMRFVACIFDLLELAPSTVVEKPGGEVVINIDVSEMGYDGRAAMDRFTEAAAQCGLAVEKTEGNV